MRTRQPTTTLEDQRIPVRVKLAAAWTSFMFLYVYVDYFALYKPGGIGDILDGVVYEFQISQTLLTVFLASIAVPTLMILLSTTLPARANRATNLVVASLYLHYIDDQRARLAALGRHDLSEAFVQWRRGLLQ